MGGKSGNASGAVIAKVRSIHGKMLKPADYDAVLHRNTVSSAVAYIKGTERYAESFSNVNETQVHRGQAELLLSKDIFEKYMRLCNFSPSERRGFNSFYLKRLEIAAVMNTVKYINSKSYDDIIAYIPSYLASYASFDLMSFASCRSFEDILAVVDGTMYYKVLARTLPVGVKNDVPIDLSDVETALNAEYIRWELKTIDKEFSERERTELREAVLRRLDMDNIVLGYRMKKYFGFLPHEIELQVAPFHYRLNNTKLREILSDSHSEELLIELLKKDYLKDKTPLDISNPEITVKRDNYRYFRSKLSTTQSGAMALYSLMVLLETERNNLTTIIEGVRYSLPVGEIERLIVI